VSLIRAISELRDDAERLLLLALADLDKASVKYWINETRRARETQICYYLQGRSDLALVNQFRQEFGLWPLTDAENKKTVTLTLRSKHIDGVAVDIVPVKNGAPWWNAPEEEYLKIATIMKKHGWKWGGDWKGFSDTPHYEI